MVNPVVAAANSGSVVQVCGAVFPAGLQVQQKQGDDTVSAFHLESPVSLYYLFFFSATNLTIL